MNRCKFSLNPKTVKQIGLDNLVNLDESNDNFNSDNFNDESDIQN